MSVYGVLGASSHISSVLFNEKHSMSVNIVPNIKYNSECGITEVRYFPLPSIVISFETFRKARLVMVLVTYS